VPDSANTTMGRHKKEASQQQNDCEIFPVEATKNIDEKQELIDKIERIFSEYNFDTITFELDVKGKIYNMGIPVDVILKSEKIRIEYSGQQLRLMLIKKA
jgi:hypothetical protein